MTETEKLNEMNYEVILSPYSSVSTITNNSLICYNKFPSKSRYSDSIDINLNFISTSITDTSVQHADRLITRERINNKQIDGNIFKDVINDAKKYLLGYVLKTVRLDLVKYY